VSGPLHGYRIVELAGIGPGPFAAMLLSDMGAEVIRVERSQAVRAGHEPNLDVLQRGRRNIAIDLKHPDGVETLLRLIERADGLIEGFRPGVMERLGVGPDVCLQRNPRLVFGRMTGWGQSGPYAQAAGHDINYIALGGALAHFARHGGQPTPPLNMIGDFGGGAMFLVVGMLAALLECQRSGQGQVVDAAMIDGTATLMSMFWGMKAQGAFDEDRPGTNLLDTGAHFYDSFRCADGLYVTIGAIEPQFYAELLRLTGLADDPEFAQQYDRDLWPVLKNRLRTVIHAKTQAEWCAILEHTDVCFAPVLTMSQAAQHPHNVARGTFIDVAGHTQPAPAPRLSRSVAGPPAPASYPGRDTRQVLADWGFDPAAIAALEATGAVKTSPTAN
jgi:alpha-methylacyl-CoA racemase